ncbi:phosphatase PAP2 family protein [Gemmobacter denitrificans]|uniref:Phosphatase PAP2 family protein n=1 Tax=Gemmobacter denitrificans TaxID=3123040 RepID=A0ABU8BZ30_9RHOB
MKHVGSTKTLQPQAHPAGAAEPPPPLHPGALASQCMVSKLVVLAACLFMAAITLDAPVQALSRSIDPSVKSVLRTITRFGNAGWPLGIGLALLGMLRLLERFPDALSRDHLKTCRSVLWLVLLSVAVSGVLASLTKHMLGRIRPSTDADAMVLEFSVMAFRADWAAFPSGHGTTAMAAATALALCFPRQTWGWLAIGALAALSRALIGVHWLSDSLAGMMLGAVITVLIYRMMLARDHRLTDAPEAAFRVTLGARSLLLVLARRWLRTFAQVIQTQADFFRGR